MSKFSLTKNTKVWCGITLYQIKAEISFGNVVKGELGGYIEKKENLSEDGDAWVSGNARVYGDAWVYGDACVSGNARVYGDAWVSGKLSLTLGYFFGHKEKKEEVKYFSLGDDSIYELIGKGNCKVEEENSQKTELLKKAEQLEIQAKNIREEISKL